MPRFIRPEETDYDADFEFWSRNPMSMGTLTVSYDVSPLQKRPERFNALLCWCIGKAAAAQDGFYILPDGQGFMEFDGIAMDVMVRTRSGKLAACDIPFSEDLGEFLADYDRYTREVFETEEEISLADDYMVIGTSALIRTELDSAVNAMCRWSNPFLIWGKIHKDSTLPISFQIHALQMQYADMESFLNRIQTEISLLDPDLN